MMLVFSILEYFYLPGYVPMDAFVYLGETTRQLINVLIGKIMTEAKKSMFAHTCLTIHYWSFLPQTVVHKGSREDAIKNRTQADIRN